MVDRVAGGDYEHQRPGRLDYRVGEVLHGADGSYRVRRVIRGGHGAVYIKLADFGLSKAFDTAGSSGITKSGTYAGNTTLR